MKLRYTGIWIALLSGVVAQAELVFEQKQIEHDASLMEERSEAVFEFVNEGKEPVRITKVASSCGCTVPQLEKNLYQPGESGEIRAIFTFGSRTGLQRKRITVQASGETTEVHELFMVTRIPEWLKVSPRILRWRMDGEATPQEMTVEIPYPDTMNVLPPETSPHFEIQRQESEPGRIAYSIQPKSLGERVTEFIQFKATVRDGELVRSREFGVHCLIR